MQDVQFVGGYKVADNGFGLGEVANFKAQMLNLKQMMI